jgi:hypothetical protein
MRGNGTAGQDAGMTFALMRGYDHINVVARLDPVAAVRDRELGDRIRRYPKIFSFGSPDFGHAVQTGDAWRIGALGCDDPSSARYSLAIDLRTAAPAEPDPATAEELAEWDALAKGILATRGHSFSVRGREFRTVRVSRMLRLGRDGPEAPRPSDQEGYNLPADA